MFRKWENSLIAFRYRVLIVVKKSPTQCAHRGVRRPTCQIRGSLSDGVRGKVLRIPSFGVTFFHLVAANIRFGLSFLHRIKWDFRVFESKCATFFAVLLCSTFQLILVRACRFYTGINWITLSFGDLFVKILVALTMLIPFRILLNQFKEISKIDKKISV